MLKAEILAKLKAFTDTAIKLRGGTNADESGLALRQLIISIDGLLDAIYEARDLMLDADLASMGEYADKSSGYKLVCGGFSVGGSLLKCSPSSDRSTAELADHVRKLSECLSYGIATVLPPVLIIPDSI